MLKRKAISVSLIVVILAEMFMGAANSYGIEFPRPDQSIYYNSSSTTSIAEFMDLAKKISALADNQSTSTSNVLPKTKVAKEDVKLEPNLPISNNYPIGNASKQDVQNFTKRKNKSEIIVKYKDIGKSEDTMKRIKVKKTNLSFNSRRTSKKLKLDTIEISDDNELINTINELKKDPNVEYAQPNYKLDLMAESTDERFVEEWGLSNIGQCVNGQTGIQGVDIKAKEAWTITKGLETVKVAIIDTGVDINHPDLAANIYKNPNERQNGLDNDGNGYVNDVSGWDFVDNNSSVFDSESEDSHGTHVAGIIAAGMNNGGVVGIASGVKIIPLKFISGNSGYTSDAIEAIEYAQKIGVSIANCSWGGSEMNDALKDAMANSSILFVCAAGNSGKNVDSSPVYPACYDLPNIVSVGANDSKGNLASFSNYGTKVNLSAPGVSILSTLPGNKYGYLSGTSMAAPFVAGTAALLKSYEESISIASIKDRILNNVNKSTKLSEKVSTSGRLNAYSALTNKVPEAEEEKLGDNGTETENQSIKSKDPQPVYKSSLEETGKREKPLLGENNLFVDALINKGLSGTLSSENGIENLSINRLKGNFVTVSWSTVVESDSELFYGTDETLGYSIKDSELSTKHQITLKIDDITSFAFYKVKSTDKGGSICESGIKSAENINDFGGEPISSEISVVEEVYDSKAQEVSTLSYIMDNKVNHSISTAQTIQEGTVFGSIEQSAQHDYYAVNLTEGKTYSIKLKGMAIGEDYDLSLYDDTNYFLAYSVNNLNYDERINYTAETTGLYYIDIQPYTFNSTSINHDYQLMVYSTENSPDSFEPNDSKETASKLTEGTMITPTLNINSDEDWFVLDTTEIGKLNVTMKSIPSGCDYDLQVFDMNGLNIGGSFSAGNLNEKLACLITKPGKYYIRIYSYTGSNPNDTYELMAGVYSADQYEVNDDIYSLTPLSKPEINFNNCTTATIDNADDVDCYKFTLPSSMKVGVRLQNIPTGTDYDMVVYSYANGTFTEVGRSTSGQNTDESVISQLVAGTYFIKIYSYSGSNEKQGYRLSLTDENMGLVSIDLDKTSAVVGEVITATVKVDNVRNISGFQVNIKYDPMVLKPIDFVDQPYETWTTPMNGSLIMNSMYSPSTNAANDLDKGIINFGSCYLNMNSYKTSGVGENSGSVGSIRFKVLKANQVQLKFESSQSMPNADYGVSLYDWNGNIVYGYNTRNSAMINEAFAVNMQSVESSSVESDDGFMLEPNDTSYIISGYVSSDIPNGQKDGFKVSVTGTSFSAITDINGYFKMYVKPTVAGYYKIEITKPNYLKRVISDVDVSYDIAIGTVSNPILLWAGDINQDNAINMSDVLKIAICFNTKEGDANYNSSCDLNNDGNINIADVIAIARHFNVNNYDSENIVYRNKFIQVSQATFHTLGLKADGTVWAWGTNDHGQFGIYPECLKESAYPVKVEGIDNVVQVEAGYSNSYFVKADGTVWACGDNNDNQLGLSDYWDMKKESYAYYSHPLVQVSGISDVKKIITLVGENQIFAIKNDGSVWSWGRSAYLHNESQVNIIDGSGIPKKIDGLSDIKDIDAETFDSCYLIAVKNDGSLIGFGRTRYDSILGEKYVIDYPSPLFNDLSNVKKVFTDSYNAGVLENDGSVWRWGSLLCGKDYITYKTPQKSVEISNVIDVIENYGFLYLLKDDGTVWAWGHIYNGVFEEYGPIKIDELSNIKSIDREIALSDDGSIWQWIQKPLPTADSKFEPVLVKNSNNDTSLKQITINGQTLNLFNPNTTGYSVALDAGTTEYPEIIAQTNHPLAICEITNATNLPGKTIIEVTSPDKTCKTIYTIDFTFLPASNSSDPSVPVDPNNPVPTFEFSANGCIDFAGDIDCYEAYLEKDKTYRIYSTGETDTYLEVMDINYVCVASNDDCEEDTNFCVTIKPTNSMLYRFRVSHFDNENGTGEYTIKISDYIKKTLDPYQVYLKSLVLEMGGNYTRNGTSATVNIGSYSAEFTNCEVINNELVVSLDSFVSKFSMLFTSDSNQLSTLSDETAVKGDYDREINNKKVSRIQRALIKLGCWYTSAGVKIRNGYATGSYWDITEASVKKYQKEYMHITPTGKADTITFAELDSYAYMLSLNKDNVKPSGVRIREYLENLTNINLKNGYVIGFDGKNITILNKNITPTITEPIYISQMTYNTNERKCYGFIGNIKYAIDKYLSDAYGHQYILETKQNMIKLMNRTALKNGKEFPVVNLYNSFGVLDQYWDANFNTAVNNFINAAVLKETYSDFGENSYDGMSQTYVKAMFLKHWTEIESVPTNDGTDIPVNIFNYPAPKEWYTRKPSHPIKDSRLKVEITYLNKYECTDAQTYYSAYELPIDRIKCSNLTTARKVWFVSTYGISDVDQGGLLGGIFTGLTREYPKEVVTGIIEGLKQIIKDPMCLPQGIAFLGNCLNPFNSGCERDLAEMLIKEAINTYIENYGTADSYEKGVIIGKAIGEILTFLIGAVKAVRTGFELVKTIKDVGGLGKYLKIVLDNVRRGVKGTGKNVAEGIKTVAEGVKLITSKLSTKFDEIFDIVDETIESGADGIIFRMVNGTEIFMQKTALRAQDITEAALKFCLTGCFTGDVCVLTSNGLKRIDEINEGDFVYSTDTRTNEKGYKEVLQVQKRNTCEFVILNVDGEEIKTTPEHLFFINQGTWQIAGELEPGDELVSSDGSIKKVISVKEVLSEQPERIYNLTIEDFHTYYVGENSVLVHNIGCGSTAKLIANASRRLTGYTEVALDLMRQAWRSNKNYSRTMFRELMKGIDDGLYSMEKVVLDGKNVNKIDVLELDAAGNPIAGKIRMTVHVDSSGKVVQVKHVISSNGVRGSGYSNALVPSGTEKGHIMSVFEGAKDNCIEDSPLNIIAQSPGVNDPRMKAFEYFRKNNCQGMETITDVLPDGNIRVRVPEADIDVTYNPLSKIATDPSIGWPDDWYLPKYKGRIYN